MLRLRQLRLRAITNHATFGADLPFAEGLNVLRAGNTSGKSTCLQAVLFALGLERSLGPRLDIPLPYAMRERIQEWKNGPYQTVLQSFVELEIENDRQQVVTVRRDVVGGTNPKLVRTWMGAQLSAPDPNAQQRDFFVFDAGASQREDGFHSFLARFLGWSLPEVTCFDGSDSPLYLETIFPMFFVEQKRGWSAIQGPLPTYFGIQDLVRRVMEFILDLDAGRIRRERADLRRSIDLIERDWAAKLAEVEDRASHSLHFKGIPRVPTAEFVQSPTIELEVFEQGEWLSVAEVITATRTLISDLEAADVPTTEQASPEVERELNVARDRAAEIAALIETIHQELTSQVAEKREIERRLSSLEADMARNQDAQKLKKLGLYKSRIYPTLRVSGLGFKQPLAAAH